MSPPNHKLGNPTLLFMVSVSFFGLILAAFFAIHPPISQEDFVWRKLVVGSTFGSVCMLGILAVFFPNLCSRFVGVGKREKQNSFHGSKRSVSISHNTAPGLRGHHPLCRRFSSHVFRINGGMFCATCSGLFLGALIVLAGIGAYFFKDWHVGQNAFLAVLIGVAGVFLGLLQSPLHIFQSSVIRLFSGIFFVVGTFLILVGIEELTHNTSVDLFFVALSVFWLMTRISLSQWNHQRICSKCTLTSCSFVKR